MSNTRLSADTLVRIYQLRKKGLIFKEIATQTGVLLSTCYYAFNILNKKISKGSIKGLERTYKQAVTILRSLDETPKQTPQKAEVSIPTPTPVNDPYTKLREAQGHMEQAIEEFIEQEVIRGISDYKLEMKQLSDENAKLREEIEELTVFKEEAKKSNWIDNLKGKFGNSAHA